MVHNTGNGPSLHKLPDKSQIPEKRLNIVVGNWEKRKWTRFRNYSSRLAWALSPIRAGRDRAVEKMFMKRLPRSSYYLDISGNTGTTDHT